ncbi:MAG: Gfo/Idh/MocA family oxidoreductase [Gammaproteobacteria bacterium]|nr:Gfo/Idh/MocA family oxidoreductase [Gammaproteobacteria bacterium]
MSEPLKIGLIGSGGIANRHLTAFREHRNRVQLMAVCDIVEDAAREYAARAGVDAIYLDVDDMLREADIEAVDICTTHDTHASLAVAAARAGKHVIVEKAMAHTLQGCRDMIAAADEADVHLMIAQHLRYSPEARAAKRLIEDGKLGEIQAVRTHLMGGGNGRPRLGHWMDDRARGGGTLLVTSVHHLDLLRFYVGNVKRVTAVCRSLAPHMQNGAEDLVAATLEFESGAIGDVFAVGGSLAPEGRGYMLFGSEGTLHSTTPTKEESEASPTRHFGKLMVAFKNERPRKERQADAWTGPTFEPLDTSGIDLPTTDYFVNEILHFEECCRTGREPDSSGRDNIETIKIIMGIFESSRRGGEAVGLDDL